jgi:hypothetical protein
MEKEAVLPQFFNETCNLIDITIKRNVNVDLDISRNKPRLNISCKIGFK